MKKIIFLLLLASSITNAQVTAFPWTETFEDASTTISQWTKIYESGNKEWTNVSTAYYGYSTGSHQGSKMAEFDITAFNGATTKYVSPILDLSGALSPTIEFYYRNKDWDGDQNELKVYYRTSQSSPWTLITNFNTSIADWTSSGVLTLPSPSATYQIALEGVAYYGCSINVDDVLVKKNSLAVSEASIVKIDSKIYPNPTSEILNVISPQVISAYFVTDYAGRNVKEEVVNSKKFEIKLGNLQSGHYILNIEDKDGNRSSQKFIKK